VIGGRHIRRLKKRETRKISSQGSNPEQLYLKRTAIGEKEGGIWGYHGKTEITPKKAVLQNLFQRDIDGGAVEMSRRRRNERKKKKTNGIGVIVLGGLFLWSTFGGKERCTAGTSFD